MWHKYINVTNVEQALETLAEYQGKARIVAGATDLILEMERGVRHNIEVLIDITRIPDLDQIVLDNNQRFHLGPLVTHNHCVNSKMIREFAYPLARAAWEVGAPQIRNRGTIAGNLITASPANDTITPLMGLSAEVKLRSLNGERVVPLKDFYTGVRKTVMRPDEMLVEIIFPAMLSNQRGTFTKLGLRNAQAISVVNVGVILTMEDERITDASITMGAVAPRIIHARQAEEFLVGLTLNDAAIQQAANLAQNEASPIDDLRGSAYYRKEMVRVCTMRGLRSIKDDDYLSDMPDHPILLWGNEYQGQAPYLSEHSHHNPNTVIETRINGVAYKFISGYDKSLLRLLREDAGLIGTKEGCAEGECGACTVFLDGVAVMSCLVPAPRAHLADIVTIEGLAHDDQLHPVQQAFIEEAAVQCGYCTPGFIMSAAKLLEERAEPSVDDIKQAITGNLCRCTGYYSIVRAIEHAAKMNPVNRDNGGSDGKIR